jgi:hypothetical protein
MTTNNSSGVDTPTQTHSFLEGDAITKSYQENKMAKLALKREREANRAREIENEAKRIRLQERDLELHAEQSALLTEVWKKLADRK